MGEKMFARTKKTFAILLAVFFVVSLTAAAVSAAPYNNRGHDFDHHDFDHHDFDHHNDNYGRR